MYLASMLHCITYGSKERVGYGRKKKKMTYFFSPNFLTLDIVLGLMPSASV